MNTSPISPPEFPPFSAEDYLAKRNPVIYELAQFITQGDTEAIDQWFFNHTKTHIKTKNQSTIPPSQSHNKINNWDSDKITDFYALAFASSKPASISFDTIYTYLEENHNMSFFKHLGGDYEDGNFWAQMKQDASVKARDVAVLKHFPLELQLKMMSEVMDERYDASYIAVLNLEAHNIDHIGLMYGAKETAQHVSKIYTHLFHQEDFVALDWLCEKIGAAFMDVTFQHMDVNGLFLFGDNPPNGAITHPVHRFNFDKPYYCAKYELMIHYSEAKEQWLESKGIAPPTLEQTQKFKEHFLIMLENRLTQDERYGLWQSQFKQHEIRLHYAHLEHQIEQNHTFSSSSDDNSDTPAKLKI